MVTIKDTAMEVAYIVIQHPSGLLDPMVEDMFQFRPLTFVQKRPNAIPKI
jgi:hypothetical protein